EDVAFLGRAFDARVYGTLLHLALRRAVERPGDAPDEIARVAIAEKEAEVPDPADRAFALDDLARVVALFREREARAAAGGFAPEPGLLELAFGAGERPVRIGDAEHGFSLRGRIDRVDVTSGRGRARSDDRRAIVV